MKETKIYFEWLFLRTNNKMQCQWADFVEKKEQEEMKKPKFLITNHKPMHESKTIEIGQRADAKNEQKFGDTKKRFPNEKNIDRTIAPNWQKHRKKFPKTKKEQKKKESAFFPEFQLFIRSRSIRCSCAHFCCVFFLLAASLASQSARASINCAYCTCQLGSGADVDVRAIRLAALRFIPCFSRKSPSSFHNIWVAIWIPIQFHSRVRCVSACLCVCANVCSRNSQLSVCEPFSWL